MKGKVLITISDMNGSRQYTPFQLFKHFAVWIFVALIIIFAIDLAIFNMLSSNETTKEQISLKSQNKMELASKR